MPDLALTRCARACACVRVRAHAWAGGECVGGGIRRRTGSGTRRSRTSPLPCRRAAPHSTHTHTHMQVSHTGEQPHRPPCAVLSVCAAVCVCCACAAPSCAYTVCARCTVGPRVRHAAAADSRAAGLPAAPGPPLPHLKWLFFLDLSMVDCRQLH